MITRRDFLKVTGVAAAAAALTACGGSSSTASSAAASGSVASSAAAKLDKIKVAVPNDTTNEARALTLLEKNGFFKLKADAGLTATKNDIAHFHSEAFSYTGNVTTNVSVCMDTQFLAHQFCTGSSVIEVTDSIYHHTQSKFGNSIRVLSRSVHHTYVVSSGSSQVNVVISRTGTYHDFQFLCRIQHFLVNDVTSDNHCIRILHCIEQLLFFCIFLQQSQFIARSFYFFPNTVDSYFSKRFLCRNQYFHNT